ncbi:MAG: hypothetical protein AAB426_02165 [Myxococcota bacterium]
MTRDFIAALEQVQAGLKDSVLRQLDPDLRGEVESVVGIGWLPFEKHSAVNEAARKVAGDRAFQEVWRRTMLRTFQQPLLKPIVDGGVRVFGLSPRTFARLTPTAWGLISRDAGDLLFEAQSGEQSARLSLRNFPLALATSGTFFLGMVGVFEAFFEATGTHGQVVLAQQVPAEGRAVYELSWQ